MNEKPQRPIRWGRTIIYSVLFLALAIWGTYDAINTGDPTYWIWVGVAVAGLVATIIVRVFMRV